MYPNTEANSFGRFIDLTTQESYTFDWNPAEIEESVEANFSRQTIPGLSHKRSQFLNTNNREIEFDLIVDGLVHGGAQSVEKIRRFLMSTVYPRASSKIEGAGAPKMLLIVPGSFRVKGYINSVKFTHIILQRYEDPQVHGIDQVCRGIGQ